MINSIKKTQKTQGNKNGQQERVDVLIDIFMNNLFHEFILC